MNQALAARWLRAGVASLWLLTALGVLHPYYREVGGEYLVTLGFGTWLMWVTCAFELALGIAVLIRPASTAITGLQIGMVLVFSTILALLDPALLAHPFGVLSKNLPFLACVVALWEIEARGWNRRSTWVLRVGMAIIWITEGLFPKVLFQSPIEVEIVANSGLVPVNPSMFLAGLGIAQVLSGIAALLLRGRWLRVLLSAQLCALVILPLLVSIQIPLLCFDPFGPVTKNIPILVGTWVVLRRCSSWS